MFRRRAYLVIWTTDLRVHVPDWGLWWSDDFEVTYCRLHPDRWLPLPFLIGLETLYGTIDGYAIRDGYGPNGMPMPKTARLEPTEETDGREHRYWRFVPNY